MHQKQKNYKCKLCKKELPTNEVEDAIAQLPVVANPKFLNFFCYECKNNQ